MQEGSGSPDTRMVNLVRPRNRTVGEKGTVMGTFYISGPPTTVTFNAFRLNSRDQPGSPCRTSNTPISSIATDDVTKRKAGRVNRFILAAGSQ